MYDIFINMGLIYISVPYLLNVGQVYKSGTFAQGVWSRWASHSYLKVIFINRYKF